MYCRNGEGGNLCNNISNNLLRRTCYIFGVNSISKYWYFLIRISYYRLRVLKI